jgi:hypothetical protein
VTFAALSTKYFKLFHELQEEQAFLNIGLKLFESEQLIDALYRIYLALLAKGWHGQDGCGLELDNIGHAYANGFYLPCVPRVVFLGEVDLRNDPLPAYAGLVVREKDLLVFHSARRLGPRLPRGYAPPGPGGVNYVLSWLHRHDQVNRHARRSVGEDTLEGGSSFVNVRPDGRIVPCVRVGGMSWNVGGAYSGLRAADCALTAACINAEADARFLWRVETWEHVVGKSQDMDTPLRLGVGPEHVQSLFYARDMPLTETGRKRPILHWVQAHERRLRSGIEVDVREHLRGITEFEMEGFPFRITSPVKRDPS